MGVQNSKKKKSLNYLLQWQDLDSIQFQTVQEHVYKAVQFKVIISKEEHSLKLDFVPGGALELQ